MSISIHAQPHDALAGLVLVVPEIEIWGGSVSFDARSQVSLAAREELPPHELATNGRLHLIPTGEKRQGGRASPLAGLHTLRKAAARRIRSVGFPFLGSTAIPQAQADALLVDLQAIETQFNDEVSSLLECLPDLFEQRQEQYPQWAKLLRQHQSDPKTLRGKFRFRVYIHSIGLPDTADAASHCERIANDALPALLADLASNAEEQLARSFTNRSIEVTQKAITPIRTLIAKLDAFSCVDPKVGPLVDALHEQMKSIPRTGALNDAQTKRVVTVLTLMANPKHLLTFGSQPSCEKEAIFASITETLKQADPPPSEPSPPANALPVPSDIPEPMVSDPIAPPPVPSPRSAAPQYSVGL